VSFELSKFELKVNIMFLGAFCATPKSVFLYFYGSCFAAVVAVATVVVVVVVLQ
jgi:hypothetical protein